MLPRHSLHRCVHRRAPNVSREPSSLAKARWWLPRSIIRVADVPLPYELQTALMTSKADNQTSRWWIAARLLSWDQDAHKGALEITYPPPATGWFRSSAQHTTRVAIVMTTKGISTLYVLTDADVDESYEALWKEMVGSICVDTMVQIGRDAAEIARGPPRATLTPRVWGPTRPESRSPLYPLKTPARPRAANAHSRHVARPGSLSACRVSSVGANAARVCSVPSR